MSQHSTLDALSASSIACNDTSDDDGDERGSSGDSTTGGSEDGSSTSLSPPSEHWLLHWCLVACIPVWNCKHPGNNYVWYKISVVASHSSEYSYLE